MNTAAVAASYCLLACLQREHERNMAAMPSAAPKSEKIAHPIKIVSTKCACYAAHLVLPSTCVAVAVECMWAAMPVTQRYRQQQQQYISTDKAEKSSRKLSSFSPDSPMKPRASRSIAGP